MNQNPFFALAGLFYLVYAIYAIGRDITDQNFNAKDKAKMTIWHLFPGTLIKVIAGITDIFPTFGTLVKSQEIKVADLEEFIYDFFMAIPVMFIIAGIVVEIWLKLGSAQ